MAEKKTDHLTMVSLLRVSKDRINELTDEVSGRTIRAYMDEIFNEKNNVISIPNGLHKKLHSVANKEGRTIEGLLTVFLRDA